MPRAATTSDTFNAIAEPGRREILTYLAASERSVGDIVESLQLELTPAATVATFYIALAPKESARCTSGPRLSSVTGSTN
jgi:DNA-binding transcriptional ArsR family regulator